MSMRPTKPMQAMTFDDLWAVYPCFVQPKINGVRCLWDGHTAWARSGKPLCEAIQRVSHAICPAGPGVLDGELVAPGEPFETVLEAVAGDADAAGRLVYRPFDLAAEGLPFRDRYEAIRSLCIETEWVHNETQLEAAMDRFLDAGYEGLIARDPDADYQSGPCKGILKYKRFEDAEFTIRGIVEASGKDAGTALLICETPHGKPFGVQPAGSRSARMRMLRDRELWIGKPYTVKFQGWTRDGLPRNYAGVGERTDVRWVMTIQV